MIKFTHFYLFKLNLSRNDDLAKIRENEKEKKKKKKKTANDNSRSKRKMENRHHISK
jgi:hypothetical protein